MANEPSTKIVSPDIVGGSARVDQWARVPKGAVGESVLGIRIESVLDRRAANPIVCRVARRTSEASDVADVLLDRISCPGGIVVVGRQVREGDSSIRPARGGCKAHHGHRIVDGPGLSPAIQSAIVIGIEVATGYRFASRTDEEKRLRATDMREAVGDARCIAPASVGQAREGCRRARQPSRERVDLVRAPGLRHG